MTVQVSITFNSIDQAIVALGKMVGAAPAPHKGAAGSAQAPVVPAPATRKGRADKGHKRGVYAPRQPEAKGEGTVEPLDSGEARKALPATAIDAVPAAAPTPEASLAEPVPSHEAAQKALEQVFEKRNLDTARDILSRYGAARLRDLKPEDRAAFIKDAEASVAGA